MIRSSEAEPQIAQLAIQHMEAEHALLGCVLFDNDALARLNAPLPAEAFVEPVHGRLWTEMCRQINAGGLAEPRWLVGRMVSESAFAEIGGMDFLADLIDAAPPSANAGHYAALVADQAQRRALAVLSNDLMASALSGKVTGAELIAETERRTAELARLGDVPEASPIGLGALEMLEARWSGAHAGVSVGLECLDRITGGIQPSHVWIVGGRTSMGKSVLVPCLGRSLAEQGRGVLMFSLEMPKDEVQARLIADIAFERGLTGYGDDPGNIRFGDILKGRGSGHQRDRARDAARKMASLPFTVVDRGGLTLDEIIAQSLRQMRAWEKAKVEPGAVIIDHLGLVKSQNQRDSKAAEVADTVDRLKEAAKRIGAPLIIAAQVNRNAESRNDKRPAMSDLNWSGSIEQIADLVCLLFREAYYLERSPDPNDQNDAAFKQNEIELIIPKNRSGPTCTLHAYVDVACNAVRDREDTYSSEYRGAR